MTASVNICNNRSSKFISFYSLKKLQRIYLPLPVRDEDVTVVKMDQSQLRMEVAVRNLSPYEKNKGYLVSSFEHGLEKARVFQTHTHTISPIANCRGRQHSLNA